MIVGLTVKATIRELKKYHCRFFFFNDGNGYSRIIAPTTNSNFIQVAIFEEKDDNFELINFDMVSGIADIDINHELTTCTRSFRIYNGPNKVPFNIQENEKDRECS